MKIFICLRLKEQNRIIPGTVVESHNLFSSKFYDSHGNFNFSSLVIPRNCAHCLPNRESLDF
jgi:hypothetical protein